MLLKIFLRILAVVYLFGAFSHFADLMDLRLKFSEMDSVWKSWIVYLAFADAFAAIGLWRFKHWGVGLFLFIALTQLVAYIAFQKVFGQQNFLVGFHLMTVAIYFTLWAFAAPKIAHDRSP